MLNLVKPQKPLLSSERSDTQFEQRQGVWVMAIRIDLPNLFTHTKGFRFVGAYSSCANSSPPHTWSYMSGKLT
jgi:hypothetical protein